MALTAFQRDVCRVLAGRRRAGGESYVAGGIALNVALAAHRLSRDLDLFHDTTGGCTTVPTAFFRWWRMRSWDRVPGLRGKPLDYMSVGAVRRPECPLP